MKKYFKYVINNLFVILMVFMMAFVATTFTIKLIDDSKSYYEATFEVADIESFEVSKLTDVDFLNEIKESGYNPNTETNKYENINVEKMLEKEDFSYTVDGSTITITTKTKYYELFFLSSSASVGTRAKMFIKDSVLKIAGEQEVTFENPKDIVTLKNNIQNKYLIATFVACGTFILELILCIFLSRRKEKDVENIVDNKTVFSNVFHKEYWRLACKPLTNVKDITMVAMMFALMLVCKLIPIPSGFGSLGIGLTYLFFSITCMIYGPIYGFVIGAVLDVLGFFMPNGGGPIFHLGYTLQTALTGMIYGLCFYRKKLTFFNTFLSRLLVNFLMNVILGSFLYIVVFYPDVKTGSAEFFKLFNSYMLLLSLPKNIVYLIPQTLLLYFVLRGVIPVLIRFNFIPKQVLSCKKR